MAKRKQKRGKSPPYKREKIPKSLLQTAEMELEIMNHQQEILTLTKEKEQALELAQSYQRTMKLQEVQIQRLAIQNKNLRKTMIGHQVIQILPWLLVVALVIFTVLR